jgi:hypothetical protein
MIMIIENSVLEVAQEIADTEKEVAELECALIDVRAKISEAKITLTPPEGWVGKNAEERALNADREYLANEDLQAAVMSERELSKDLLTTKAELAGSQDARRALELVIKLREIAAMTGTAGRHNTLVSPLSHVWYPNPEDAPVMADELATTAE